ncbi:MAG: SEC-C domain-containing protein [Planctomycetes bacterium]|nr:SEC-C domain-containing protein [Planctomycetota bacterium]
MTLVHAFSARYEELVAELVSEAWITDALDRRIPPPDSQKFLAVWDTGASQTCISARAVEQCGLSPVGMTRVDTANGEADCRQYLVNFFFPNGVAFEGLRVTEVVLQGRSDLLVGMDVVARGDFAVTNTEGKTVFTYRNPSVSRIDFVADMDADRRRTSRRTGAGRNDPCPCGSGKKFKSCCGR